jgi:small multidrug resistance pump
MSTTPYYTALAISILLGVAAQLMLKIAAERAGEAWLPQFLSAYTIGGLIVYGVAFFLYVVAIRRIPLSLAFPMVALSYVMVAVAAHYMWGELFGWPQLIGMALIGAGIIALHQG